MFNIVKSFFLILIFIIFLISNSFAEEKKELTDLVSFVIKLEGLMKRHNDIRASNFDTQALESNLKAIKKTRFPTVSITSSGGREQLVNNAAADTITNPRDFNLKMTVPVFNMTTGHTIEQVKLSVDQGEVAGKATEDRVLLEAISAHLGIIKARKLLSFADESVANIRKQTELESAKVSKGAGLDSDVLQAKAQLAGAEARRMQALTELKIANNRYSAVFGVIPGEKDNLVDLPFPSSAMPESEGAALSIAVTNSPAVLLQKVGASLAKKSVDAIWSTNFLPTINFTIDNKYKNDNAGAQGFERDTVGKIELSYSFNTAGSSIDAVNVAKRSRSAASLRYDQSIILVQEQVQNTWTTYEMSKKNAEFRSNQAEIAKEFLRLAREEQALGQRSLLEVLAGETAYINAAADAEVANSLVVQSAYNLLATIGKLDLSIFSSEN